MAPMNKFVHGSAMPPSRAGIHFDVACKVRESLDAVCLPGWPVSQAPEVLAIQGLFEDSCVSSSAWMASLAMAGFVGSLDQGVAAREA